MNATAGIACPGGRSPFIIHHSYFIIDIHSFRKKSRSWAISSSVFFRPVATRVK